jgi:hypothetical protein
MWLKLIRKASLIDPKDIDLVYQESDELCRIIGKSVFKRNGHQNSFDATRLLFRVNIFNLH